MKITYKEVIEIVEGILNDVVNYARDLRVSEEEVWEELPFDEDSLLAIHNFAWSHRPPTFDEAVKAWEDALGEVKIIENDEGLRVVCPNGIYYLINLEQVYSNRKVYSMNVDRTLSAINLTIKYLESLKEGKNE